MQDENENKEKTDKRHRSKREKHREGRGERETKGDGARKSQHTTRTTTGRRQGANELV